MIFIIQILLYPLLKVLLNPLLSSTMQTNILVFYYFKNMVYHTLIQIRFYVIWAVLRRDFNQKYEVVNISWCMRNLQKVFNNLFLFFAFKSSENYTLAFFLENGILYYIYLMTISWYKKLICEKKSQIKWKKFHQKYSFIFLSLHRNLKWVLFEI